MTKGIEYGDLQRKTDIYISNFKNGNFDIASIKHNIELE